MANTPSYLKSLKKESVVQSVINRLTEGMRRGELKPGDRIPTEPELAESLGVARSSVREAIKILTYLGVLESRRPEGTFVCNGYTESMIDPMVYGMILNQDSFDNLMELREMTEDGILRLAIRNHDQQDLEDLKGILTEMEDIIGSEDEGKINRFFAADDRFHNKVAEMGRNTMTDKIDRVVRTLTYAMRYDTVSSMISRGKGKELLDAHTDLYEAIMHGRESDLTSIVRKGYFEEELRENRKS